MPNATATHQVYGSPHLAAEIVATMQEPFVLLDSSLRLVTASSAFFARFALDRATTLGRPLYDWGAGEWDTPLTHQLFDDLAPKRQVVEAYSLEVRYPGTERPRVQASVRPVREIENQIVAYLVGFVEVRDENREKAGDLLDRLRRRAGDLVAVIDVRTGGFVAVDGAARELTGYTAGELQGMKVDAIAHPDDRQLVVKTLTRLESDEPHRKLTFRAQHRDGRVLWLETMCDVCPEAGSASLIHIVARDVTDRKRAEESLRWLGRQVKLILDSAADGIFGVDPRGNITFINPAAARLLGYRVPELLGRSYRDLLKSGCPEHDRLDIVSLTLGDGLGRDLREFTLLCGDGSELLVEMSCSVARDRGDVTGAVVIFRGIAERKRSETAARRAEWLAGVGETTIAVRHEINNPLTTLLAEARLLEMGGNTPEEEREMVGAVCDQARRIADVIRRLTETQDDPIVRYEGNQRMLDLRPVV